MFITNLFLGTLAFLQLFFIFFHSFLEQKEVLTKRHLFFVNKMLLTLGMFCILLTGIELFEAWTSGSIYEQMAFYHRALGKRFLLLLIWFHFGALAIPQLFWFKVIRESLPRTVIVCLFILVNYFLSNYSTTFLVDLNNDFIPSSWN